eukprot:13362975-Alexandrium_andersonii.AAC.1
MRARLWVGPPRPLLRLACIVRERWAGATLIDTPALGRVSRVLQLSLNSERARVHTCGALAACIVYALRQARR